MARKSTVSLEPLRRKLAIAQNTCRTCSPQIDYLETLAAAEPAIAAEVNDLRVKLEHLTRFTDVGLAGLTDGTTGDEQ